MTMMSNEDRAAEYVLGVLTREEREAVRRASATDPALAEEIENWNEQLSSLLLDAPEVEPPADMFDRITAAIAASARPQAEPAGSRTRAAGSSSAPASSARCCGTTARRAASPS
jgi:anti-sigma-K factor RskA